MPVGITPPLPSNLPLTTRVIQTAGEAAQNPQVTATPEDVNNRVDELEQVALEASATKDDNQQARKDFAATVFIAQNQKQSFETFVEASTDEETDDNAINTDTLASVARSAKINRAANAIDSSDITKESIQDLQRRNLENKISNIIDNDSPINNQGSENQGSQPTVDILA